MHNSQNIYASHLISGNILDIIVMYKILQLIIIYKAIELQIALNVVNCNFSILHPLFSTLKNISICHRDICKASNLI